MARYMSTLSAKLSFLAGLCRQICLIEKRKLLVFADWPLTLWNASAFLMNLDLSLIDIRSAHKPSERQLICDLFNDKTERVDVLLTHITHRASIRY